MGKALWEYSAKELEAAIAVTQAILDTSGYHKQVADHLALLQEQLEERQIEDSYRGRDA